MQAQETRRKRRLNVNVNVKKEKEEKEEDERRRRRRARKRKEERRAKAVVDEDLYHIPPHLLLPSSNRHTHTLRVSLSFTLFFPLSFCFPFISLITFIFFIPSF